MNKSNKKQVFNTKTKKGKRNLAFLSLGIACVVALSIALPIVLLGKEKPFKIPALSVPIEDEYALTKYKYSELDDVQTTVRADTMVVTERNLPRITPTLLSDDFALIYNKDTNTLSPYYGNYTASSSNEKVSKISFNPNNYPEPYYKKGSKTTGVYVSEAAAAGVSEAEYYAYYKYMYLTQGQHLAKESIWRSAQTASTSDEVNADFAAWLKKHPSADGQYGAVKGENNAVKKEIILDPLYRSLHSTGLYLPAGEPVTIKIEGLKAGETISIQLGSHSSMGWRGSVPNQDARIKDITGGKSYNQVNYQNSASDYFFKQADIVTAGGQFFDCNKGDSQPFLQSQWKRQNARAPWLDCTFTFTENKTYTFGFAFGGLIQISMDRCYSQVKTTITGAVETPHYILGVTTPEYFDTYLRKAPGVIAVLDTENGILTGPTGELDNTYLANMRTVKKEEIDKLAMLWHSFLAVNESFTGGTYNRFNKVHFDWHVPAGAAVSLGNYTFAQPTGWFTDAMNYQGLLKRGTWGTLHEIGHNHGAAYGVVWGFGTAQEGEVRNNALTLLSYILFCDVGTTIRHGGSAEHGGYANPYNVLTETLRNKGAMTDFNQAGYWRALGMYSNIMHSFGAEKFYELLYTYKLTHSYSDNKHADFAFRCASVYGMNFLKYFNEFYAAKITDAMFTEEQLEYMKALPDYCPVSSYYAGGIDGVKTAGDYIVNFGDDIEFDLLGKTISLLDEGEEKGFKIISVDKPKYGSIKSLGDGKYAYSFNKGYTGATDEFSYNVKLKDGVIHKLTIYLRLTYNGGARVSSYTGFENTALEWDSLYEQIQNMTPKIEASSTGPTLPSFSTTELEVRTADFWWNSPVTGEVAFMIGGNCVKLFVGEDFENLEPTGLIFSGNVDGTSTRWKHVLKVEKGKKYALRIMSYRNSASKGGGGSVTILQKNGEVVVSEDMNTEFASLVANGAKFAVIPTTQVSHIEFPIGKVTESYEFEPEFLVSKKDKISLSTTGTDKTIWEVLKAPEFIHGGRIETQIQYVVQVDENGNEILDENGDPVREAFEVEIDKWSYLIDGEAGTYLHTAYTGSYVPLSEENPHEFIIDTKKIQDLNFFTVTTRNHANSYIEAFEFYTAEKKDINGEYEWVKVGEGDRSNYVKNSITLKFPTRQARYLRLVVKKASGVKFSVLAEINAGVESPTQKLVSSSSSKLFTTSGWHSSSKIESEPNGYLVASKANEKAVIKFIGDSISLYAAVGEEYGSVKIIIDGVEKRIVDLSSSIPESRKLVFYAEGLEVKEHTMEIITTGSERVMLNVIGLPYTGSLLNAPNIYLEKALTISLIVFVLLFAAFLAFTLCLLFIPKFRKLMGNNRAINWLDKRIESDNAKRKAKKEAKKANVSKNEIKAKSVSSKMTTTNQKPQNSITKTQKPVSLTSNSKASTLKSVASPTNKTVAKKTVVTNKVAPATSTKVAKSAPTTKSTLTKPNTKINVKSKK